MKPRRLLILGLLLAAIVGGSIVALNTRIGPGVGGDATIYIVAARNLVAGEGLGWIQPDGSFQLLADFPPGYPLVLALPGLFGADLITAARWINILLFAAITFLAGNLVFEALSSPVYALLTAGLVMVSPVLIPVFSWAMSEPVFLFSGFLAIYFLWRYFSNLTFTWLVLAASAAGYAFLTRYSGMAFVAAGALALFAWENLPLLKRLKNALTFLVLGSLPMVAWLLIDFLHSGRVSSRRLGTGESLQGMLSDFWLFFSESLNMWVMPDSWAVGGRFPQVVYHLVPILLLGIVFGGGIWALNRTRPAPNTGGDKRLLRLLGLFASVYFLVIAGTRFLIFPTVAISNRMLSPLYLAVLLMGVLVCAAFSDAWLKRSWMRWILPALLGLGIVWYAYISFHVVSLVSRNGLGYTALSWQQSELIQAVRLLPEDTVLVTNEPKAVLLLTGRVPYQLEEIYYREPLTEFTRYGDGILIEDEGQQAFREGAALVLFNSINRQMEGLYAERKPERLAVFTDGLLQTFKGSDGAIYFYPEAP